MDAIAQTLRHAGLKVTAPRRSVLEQLGQHADHPTAEDLFWRLQKDERSIGLATVYRVLSELEATGLVRRIKITGGKARFERASNAPHFHWVNAHGQPLAEFTDTELRQRLQQLAQNQGWQIVDIQMQVHVQPDTAEHHPI